MRIIDLLFLLIILLSALNGWRNGFLYAAVGLITWVGSIAAGFALYTYLAAPLGRTFPSLGAWTFPLAFMGTIILVHLLLTLFLNVFLGTLPDWAHDNWLNKFLGLFPGLINGIITSAIVALLLMALPLSDNLSDKLRDSRIANRLTLPAEWVEERLSPVFDRPVKRTISRLTIEPHSDEFIKLPFTTDRIWVRPDLESQMLVLVNEERAKAGAGPLVADTALRAVARAHSRDMFERGYFSHYTPEGRDPFVRMRAANIRFLTAGENLALAQTLSIAHTGLMHSPGHRANILNPAFHRVGIGILEGGVHGLMVSQEFRN